MPKAKSAKGTVNVPNKILHSRVSYLYQAASYLVAQQPHSESGSKQYQRDTSKTSSNHPKSIEANGAEHGSSATLSEAAAYRPASRRMISDLRSVTLKGQMRISPAMKHSICKKCDTLLVDGSTCTNEVENKSKEGRKPWADVLQRGRKGVPNVHYQSKFNKKAMVTAERMDIAGSLETLSYLKQSNP
ncbi:hypothetical protein LCER1_G001569 [Lachnellula cervina]|uniref:Uncharacterized protein n=1 Tax=Lachnellula cervina TaxID=1316786 RepID=A0A7D8YXN6_9HELO|nr:hypothetical protein LCER1_G001569 [Lachnellula cervina]